MKSTLRIAGVLAVLGLGLFPSFAPWPGLGRETHADSAPVSATATNLPTKPKLAVSIKPQHVADALRTVILSDREVYLRLVLNASETPATAKMPSPCEVLRLGSHTVASKGVEYSYVLRALQPINRRNLPETDVETKGLQFVGTRPDLCYATEELLGGRWYFTAVYPDVATSQRCADCHNQHRAAQTSPYKLGDVLGALVVRIALEL